MLMVVRIYRKLSFINMKILDSHHLSMRITIEENICKYHSCEYNIHGSKFSKLETNIGMLHF